MSKFISWSIIICSVFFSAACSESAQLDGFDSKSWKNDAKACKGTRQKMQTDFEAIRKELYGRQEKEIRAILGKPDGEELMARGQRLFYYYLESGTQCDQKDLISLANKAEIRFNALTKVSEITYTYPLGKR